MTGEQRSARLAVAKAGTHRADRAWQIVHHLDRQQVRTSGRRQHQAIDRLPWQPGALRGRDVFEQAVDLCQAMSPRLGGRLCAGRVTSPLALTPVPMTTMRFAPRCKGADSGDDPGTAPS